MNYQGKLGTEKPSFRDVKIYFQGGGGSGKSLLAGIVMEALRTHGLDFCTLLEDSRKKQIVDLTKQNLDDTILVRNPVRDLIP